MPIPLKERNKVNQQIARIETGNFDANDVDGLLIKMRPYAGQKIVFREIADFVAHADARMKGVTHGSMTAFADSLRFFMEFVGVGKKQFEISEPFPSYVYRLFISQSRQANEAHLMDAYKLSSSSLIKKIEGNFVRDNATKTCSLRPGKGGKEFFAALQYVMGFIHARPAFHLSDFHAELKDVLSAQKIAFNDGAFDAQSNRIGLAIMCLISGAEVALPDGEKAKCVLECEHHFRILRGQRQLPTDAVTTEPSNFGTLRIMAEIPVISGDAKPLRASYAVVDSDLDPHEHCHPSLFLTADEPNEFGPYVVEIINFAEDMSLSRDFEIIRSDSVVA